MCKGLADYLEARAEVYAMLAEELYEAAAVARDYEDDDFDLDVIDEDPAVTAPPKDDVMSWFESDAGKDALRAYGYDPDSDPDEWAPIATSASDVFVVEPCGKDRGY